MEVPEIKCEANAGDAIEISDSFIQHGTCSSSGNTQIKNITFNIEDIKTEVIMVEKSDIPELNNPGACLHMAKPEDDPHLSNLTDKDSVRTTSDIKTVNQYDSLIMNPLLECQDESNGTDAMDYLRDTVSNKFDSDVLDGKPYDDFMAQFKETQDRKMFDALCKNIDSGFTCIICSFNGDTFEELEKHTNTEHAEKLIFPCKFCDKEFISYYFLHKHVLLDHEKRPLINCKFCDRQFYSKRHLTPHMDAFHQGIRPYKCDLCDFTSASKLGTKKHKIAVHEKRRDFACDLCDFRSATKSYIKEHKDMVHAKLKPFLCPICSSVFSRKIGLDRHISAVHEKQKPFTCELCSISFTRQHSLKKHISNIHVQEKRTPTKKMGKLFLCNFCKFSAHYPSTLKEHMTAVHTNERPYKCDQCDYTCARKTDARRHAIVHDKNRELKDKIIQCPRCDFSSKNKNDLKKHVLTLHEKLEQFECEKCDFKSFRQRSFKRHILNMHGEKTCLECEFTCIGGLEMRKHIAKNHRKDLYDLDETISDIRTIGPIKSANYLDDAETK